MPGKEGMRSGDAHKCKVYTLIDLWDLLGFEIRTTDVSPFTEED